MFKSLKKDNSTFDYQIYGSMSKASNVDISSISLGNYDDDTKLTYKLAQLAVRDNFGDSNNNGLGNLYIRTNRTGGLNTSNLTNAICCMYNGFVGINNDNPQYNLHVDGDIFCTRLIASNISNNTCNSNNTIYTQIQSTPLSRSIIKETSYITCSTCIMQSSNLSKAIFLSHLTTSNVSDYTNSNFKYDARIVDITTNTTLGEAAYSNYIPTLNTLALTNLNSSTTPHILELQMKKTLGQYIKLESLSIY